MTLPYLTEQERDAEWLDVQSLYEKLGETFTASLARVAAAYVSDEQGLSRRQWQLGELLSDGELEWTGEYNEFWELVTGYLYEISGGWLAFSQSTLKYYARTARRCAMSLVSTSTKRSCRLRFSRRRARWSTVTNTTAPTLPSR